MKGRERHRRAVGFRIPAVLLAVVVAGCASLPTPGEAGYPFNLQGRYEGALTLPDTTYLARIRMETGRGGHVSGSFSASGPADLRGDLSGTLEGDSLVWRSSWVAPATGCSGILLGRGPVDRGGASLKGSVRMRGSCAESDSGSYELRR